MKLIVLSPPHSKQLSMLQRLPKQVEVTIGESLSQLGAAVKSADAFLFWEASAESFREALAACEKVKWVHSKSAGVENILFPELVERDIILTNSQGVYARSLAEFALTGMLYFAKDLPRMLRNQKSEHWEQYDVEELNGRTLGIFGFGGIGQQTARRAKAMGMRVIAIRRSKDRQSGVEFADELLSPEDKRRLIEESDYFLVSAPLTSETVGAIGRKEISYLKPSAVFLNLGRGPIVDESALIEALQQKKIRGAVLDVFETEPLPQGNPLWQLSNVLVSPHTADHTATWKDESMEFFLGNVARYLAGEPLANRCDKRAGY